MGERPLTALGIQMRDSLPPVLRTSPEYLATVHALARELERVDGCVEQVRTELNPATATLLLPAWEKLAQLPVGGAGGSIDQRRMAVLARLRRLTGASEGREWEQEVTDIVGPGWTYQEHVPGDPSTPPAYTVRITLPYAADNPNFAPAQKEIRVITPAHIVLEFVGGTGFLVDVGELDVDVFAA